MYEKLFWTPVMKTHLGRDFSEEEMSYIKSFKDFSLNSRNYSTNDKNVLDKGLEDLRSHLQDLISLWVQDIICPQNEYLDWQITQSWINYTETGGIHHKHKHCNSVISGVVYINAIENDKIRFFNPVHQSDIEIPPERYNEYNSYTWDVPVTTGDIVLFPSNLFHMVPEFDDYDRRISLAFNVFPRGDLGRYDQTTYLQVP